MAQLQTALEAHEQSDRLIDLVQSIGIGVCAVGIIVSCATLIFVAFLLRAAATSLSKDMRGIMADVAANKLRLEEIEFRLEIDRQNGDSPDANHAKGS